MLTTTQWIVLLAVVALAVGAAIAFYSARSLRRRHAELRHRFGPEYDREVEQRGSVARAERELLAREKRIDKQRLQPLPEVERARFAEDWVQVQARFVDDPSAAVQAADELIKAVMTARGYDTESFDQRVADLSVDHAGVIQHYRAAHDLAAANREGRADTEDLRQAVVHYRALFDDLLEPPVEYGRIEPSQSSGDQMLPR
jgi:hypothetical protein